MSKTAAFIAGLAALLLIPAAALGKTTSCRIFKPARINYADQGIQLSQLRETGLPRVHVPEGSPCNAARALAYHWEDYTAQAEGLEYNTFSLTQPPASLSTDPSDQAGHEVSPWMWSVNTSSFDEDYSWSTPDYQGDVYDTGWLSGQVRFRHGRNLVTMNASVYTGTTDCGPDYDTGGLEWCTRNLAGGPNFKVYNPAYGQYGRRHPALPGRDASGKPVANGLAVDAEQPAKLGVVEAQHTLHPGK
jgi:hypothetical protein